MAMPFKDRYKRNKEILEWYDALAVAVAVIALVFTFGLRVVQGYDQKTKTDTVSIDMLCGVKTLSPELAAVITDKR